MPCCFCAFLVSVLLVSRLIVCINFFIERRRIFLCIFRHEPVLIQEMLIFLVQLVKERRFCGRSTADNLKRELIYKLAIGDATHSQIVKSLPRDLSSSEQLQNVLDSLAVYSNPSGMKQV